MVLSTEVDQTKKIALLNDAFRITFIGGTICVTSGLHLLGDEFVKAALLATREFDQFDADNDPHNEHDFGSLVIEPHRLFWKIDYYDPTMLNGSEDPTDVRVTRRVLTIMLAAEY